MKLTFPQALILLVAISASIAIFFLPMEEIVAAVGEDKIYLAMYLIAFFGSISTFAGIPYPLFVLSFIANGFDPLFIGLAAAAGATTSDTLTFLLVKKGRRFFGENILSLARRLEQKVQQHPRWVVPGLYAYGALAPFSNDFATIPFALMKYPALKVLPPLALGKVTYMLFLAFVGGGVLEWFLAQV